MGPGIDSFVRTNRGRESHDVVLSKRMCCLLCTTLEPLKNRPINIFFYGLDFDLNCVQGTHGARLNKFNHINSPGGHNQGVKIENYSGLVYCTMLYQDVNVRWA